jgi:hypothetical protein
MAKGLRHISTLAVLAAKYSSLPMPLQDIFIFNEQYSIFSKCKFNAICLTAMPPKKKTSIEFSFASTLLYVQDWYGTVLYIVVRGRYGTVQYHTVHVPYGTIR